MIAIHVTAPQQKMLLDAMDLVVKTYGISCLQNVLPVVAAIQTAREEPSGDNVVPITSDKESA